VGEWDPHLSVGLAVVGEVHAAPRAGVWETGGVALAVVLLEGNGEGLQADDAHASNVEVVEGGKIEAADAREYREHL
jgi:hypothetical protein